METALTAKPFGCVSVIDVAYRTPYDNFSYCSQYKTYSLWNVCEICAVNLDNSFQLTKLHF